MRKVIVVLFFIVLLTVIGLEIATFINMIEFENTLPNVDYLRRLI